MRFPPSPKKLKAEHCIEKAATGSGCGDGVEMQAVKGFACEHGTKTAYKALSIQLATELPYLPKHYLVDIRKQVTAQFVKRFKRSRIPKYGALNKGFTEQEVGAFFRAIDSPKFHLLFSYQAQLGLRIGEAIRISLKDICFESRELVVKTEKAMTLDTLLIPAPLFQETLAYIQANGREIEKARGFLFFNEYGKSRTIEPHLYDGYVRNQFRRFAEAARLDEVDDQSEESRPNRAVRWLHRLTTHSLRHYAITRFSEQNNGNVLLTSKFARHLKPDTTMGYIHVNRKALYAGIDSAFQIGQAVSLKARLSEPR